MNTCSKVKVHTKLPIIQIFVFYFSYQYIYSIECFYKRIQSCIQNFPDSTIGIHWMQVSASHKILQYNYITVLRTYEVWFWKMCNFMVKVVNRSYINIIEFLTLYWIIDSIRISTVSLLPRTHAQRVKQLCCCLESSSSLYLQKNNDRLEVLILNQLWMK